MGALQWSASEGGRVGYRFAVVSEMLAQSLASTLERFEEAGGLDLTPLDSALAHCFEIVSRQLEDDDMLSIGCACLGDVPLDAIVGNAPTKRLSSI